MFLMCNKLLNLKLPDKADWKCINTEYWFPSLKVPYYEKRVFFDLYIYKLVLPEPANSQNYQRKASDSCMVSVKLMKNSIIWDL